MELREALKDLWLQGCKEGELLAFDTCIAICNKVAQEFILRGNIAASTGATSCTETIKTFRDSIIGPHHD